MAASSSPGSWRVFSALEAGEWQFRELGTSGQSGPRICLGNPVRFVQIAHGGAACESFVIKNEANMLTVSYKCGGRGQGMTSIRMETSKLIQLRTQGIRDGAPFSSDFEARRVGSC